MKHVSASLLFVVITALAANAQVLPGAPDAVPVEFRFTHTLGAADSGVGLNGSFNAWTGGVFVMRRQADPTLWKCTVDLGQITYEYKFVTYTDTVGQAGVTAYFTDPLNPRQGGPFNNSFITVKSPMIYYFLPKSGSSVQQERPELTANITWANNAQLALNRTVFKIDGTVVPNAGTFINTATRMFSYTPPAGLSYAQHTAYLKVFTVNGDSAELTTQFRVSGFFSMAPQYFYFDSKSPSFRINNPINRVEIKADFNGSGSTPMTDPDSDGVYTFGTNVGVNDVNQYTYIINSADYINDPDNPLLSSSHRTMVIKRLFPYPAFTSFMPASGKVYPPGADSLRYTFVLTRSDSAVFIDTGSVVLTLDGAPLARTFNFIGSGFEITTAFPKPAAGRHVIAMSGSDVHGVQAAPAKVTFGIYPTGTGFHAVDGEGDDKGPGSYTTIPGALPGAADLQEVTITATAGKDSIIISVKMKQNSIFTRLGFFIVNQVTDELVAAPYDVQLRIPAWHGKGVFAAIANPRGTYFNAAEENRLFSNSSPFTTAAIIVPDSAALVSREFRFKLPLAVLESIMGSFRGTWNFGIYSYYRNQNGTFKVGEAQGGTASAENTNVYDVAFFGDTWLQERALANYIPLGGIGGPRIAAIGYPERGAAAVRNSDIDTLLGAGPEVKLFASGGPLWQDTVTITGRADVNPGSAVKLYVNGRDTLLATGANRLFSAKVRLTEGANAIYATTVFNSSQISRSPVITYTRVVAHAPVAKIYGSAAGSSVTLKADSTVDPDNSVLSYSWAQDSTNPARVTISGAGQATAGMTIPAATGEYYFTLTATNTAGKTGWARTVVVNTDSGIVLPDQGTWHPAWVDTQVVYSVFIRTFGSNGKFADLTARMAELKDLGVTTLWLLPIHPTIGNLGPDNPGYAITNYLDVMPQYGTLHDFRELVRTAHQYNIKVTLDFVVQHTSDQHYFMKDANRFKGYSPYYPFYMWDANGNYQYLFTWASLPSINYDSPVSWNHILDAGRFWMHDIGVDGYRCDVAWAINDIRATGPAFWQRFRSVLKTIRPDMYLLAEADARYPRYFDRKFDGAYGWDWFGRVRSLMSGTGSIAGLDTSITHYYATGFPKHARPMNFMENQDEQRFIEAFGVAATKQAAALMFAVPGTPHLYAGQEAGEYTFRGMIDWSDPQNLRPYYKKLIRLRGNNKALSLGTHTMLVNTAPTQVYSFFRRYGNNAVIGNFNFSGQQVTASIRVPMSLLPFDSTATFYLNDELNNISYPVQGLALTNYEITLPGNGSQILVLSSTPLVDVEEEQNAPDAFALGQNYPNPFNPSTTIRYSVPFESSVSLTVYNVLGQKISEVVNRQLKAGNYDAVWGSSSYASGIYFYELTARPVNGGEPFRSVKKMLLVK